MLANTGPKGKQARPLEGKDKMDPCGSMQDGTERFLIFIFPGMLHES